MSEKKKTCPVCFTKMRPQNNVLVCPECGYKLCDHSYLYHDSYSTEHTHTPNYTTSYRTNVPASANHTQQPGNVPASANRAQWPGNVPAAANRAQRPGNVPAAASRPNTAAGNSTGNSRKMTAGGKIVSGIVITYIVAVLFSVFSSVLFSIIKILF